MVVSIALFICILAVIGITALYSYGARFSISDEWAEMQGQVVEAKYAIEDFRLDNGRYPTQDEGLVALLRLPPATRSKSRYFPNHYLRNRESLEDPWGRPLGYRVMRDGCEVFSLGADGKQGGHGANEDFSLQCDAGPRTVHNQ